jgi:hypothetical protein
MQGLITELVRENRRPLRELPEPVGRTVRTMAIGKDNPIIVDEPAADVLRSREGLELGDTVEYDVELVGVFKAGKVGAKRRSEGSDGTGSVARCPWKCRGERRAAGKEGGESR